MPRRGSPWQRDADAPGVGQGGGQGGERGAAPGQCQWAVGPTSQELGSKLDAEVRAASGYRWQRRPEAPSDGGAPRAK